MHTATTQPIELQKRVLISETIRNATPEQRRDLTLAEPKVLRAPPSWTQWNTGGIVLMSLVPIAAFFAVGRVFPPAFWLVTAWVVAVVTMAGIAFVAGSGMNRTVWALLIDNRNRMSVSRLQFVAWYLIVVPALGAGYFYNALRAGDVESASQALMINVPEETWLVLVVSLTSLLAAPLLLRLKMRTDAHQIELAYAKLQVSRQDRVDVGGLGARGQVFVKGSPEEARVQDSSVVMRSGTSRSWT
jgi:hypothetical protein